MAGMVGSNRGWVEAPYVPCPAGLDDLAAELRWVEPDRIAIVPGLSVTSPTATPTSCAARKCRCSARSPPASIPADLPRLPPRHPQQMGRPSPTAASSRFRTVMTGEMFSHAAQAQHPRRPARAPRPTPGAAFRDGVRRGLDAAALTAELFSVRARVLLGDLRARDAAVLHQRPADRRRPRASASASPRAPTIVVMGRPELTELYAAAAADAGHAAREVDGEHRLPRRSDGHCRGCCHDRCRPVRNHCSPNARWSRSSAASRPTRPKPIGEALYRSRHPHHRSAAQLARPARQHRPPRASASATARWSAPAPCSTSSRSRRCALPAARLIVSPNDQPRRDRRHRRRRPGLLPGLFHPVRSLRRARRRRPCAETVPGRGRLPGRGQGPARGAARRRAA